MPLRQDHVKGLDTLRFVLALWVLLSHTGGPPLPDFLARVWAARAFYNNAFPGPVAVIVFFVISGFCIHFPRRRDLRLTNPLSYYSRRYVRILVPMAVAVAVAAPLGLKLTVFGGSILWSLLCEEVYYAIYPALLALRRRVGWTPVVAASFLCAYAVVLSNPSAGDYASFGSGLNWVVGLPCWLLGCVLAERADALGSVRVARRAVWVWRLSAFLLAVTLSALRFHSPLTYPWTLDLFAVFAFFWLAREVSHRKHAAPNPLLEKAGAWSYSTYLVHMHAYALASALPVGWPLQIAFVLAACYAFYRAVERPSHLLARRLGERLAGRAVPLTSEAEAL